MARGKFARSQGKKWSTFTLVFFMLFMLSIVLLVLLALGIVSLPVTADDPPPTDLSAFRRKISERYHPLSVLPLQHHLELVSVLSGAFSD